MNHWAKSGLTLLAVAGLLALVFLVRYQMVQGRFQSVENVRPGLCRAVATGLPGTADLAVDKKRGLLLIAARASVHPGPRDGLYVLNLRDPASAPARLSGVPPDFHPGGLDFFSGPEGDEVLAVIDAKKNGTALVETFTLAAGAQLRLVPQMTVRGGLLTGPSDLAMIGPSAFYLANAYVSKGRLGRFAEEYLLWPHADVLAFNGMGFHIAVQRIAAPSSVLARGRFLYVAARNGRRLLAFTREDFTGNLTEIGSLRIPARLDKISLDDTGNLIAAGEAKPGTAQIYRVRLGGDGVPQSYETLFSDDGMLVKGASAAALAGGHLFIGSASDQKVLDCAIK